MLFSGSTFYLCFCFKLFSHSTKTYFNVESPHLKFQATAQFWWVGINSWINPWRYTISTSIGNPQTHLYSGDYWASNMGSNVVVIQFFNTHIILSLVIVYLQWKCLNFARHTWQILWKFLPLGKIAFYIRKEPNQLYVLSLWLFTMFILIKYELAELLILINKTHKKFHYFCATNSDSIWGWFF